MEETRFLIQSLFLGKKFFSRINKNEMRKRLASVKSFFPRLYMHNCSC